MVDKKKTCGFCDENCGNDHCFTNQQMDFPVVTLDIPEGVASFKGQFTDSEGNVWEVEAKRKI